MLIGFQNSFTGRLTGKFATNSYLNIPPRLNYVATLPCEIFIWGSYVQEFSVLFFDSRCIVYFK